MLVLVFTAILFGAATAGTSETAVLGDVPYQISVWQVWESIVDHENHTSFVCAGALVTPEYVLTSWSCVEEAARGTLQVLLAAGHLQGKDPTTITYHVMDNWIQHQDYDMWSGIHDIALIKVSPPFEESAEIKVIPLRKTPPALETSCIVSGWKEDYYDTSDVLKFETVRTLNRSLCDYMWGDELKEAMQICAGIPKAEAANCNVGEEGGPLVCDGQLTGVFSDTAAMVCISGEPSVYLDVAYYYEWIVSSIATGPTTTVSTVAPTTPSTTTPTTTPRPTTTRPTTTTTPSPNVNVQLGEVPYQMSVWQVYEFYHVNNTVFECAGTLIHEQFVVTTRRCADEAEKGSVAVVVAGGHLNKDNQSDIEFHHVVEIIRHEDYDIWTYANDIALLKVSPAFEFSASIAPVSIRTTAADLETACTISGWKEDYFDTSDVLLSSPVATLNKTLCYYLDENKPDVYRTKMCAGIQKGQPGQKCNVGDEGGPLVCDDQLTGIFSDFPSVCTTPSPGIYLDVAYFADWIANKTGVATPTTTTTPQMTTTLSTTDHTTGVVSGGGARSSLYSSVDVIFMSVVSYLVTRFVI